SFHVAQRHSVFIKNDISLEGSETCRDTLTGDGKVGKACVPLEVRLCKSPCNLPFQIDRAADGPLVIGCQQSCINLSGHSQIELCASGQSNGSRHVHLCASRANQRNIGQVQAFGIEVERESFRRMKGLALNCDFYRVDMTGPGDICDIS